MSAAIGGLPFALSLPEPGLHAFHASPLGDDIYICEDIARGGPWLRPEAEIAADLHGIESPLIVFGHSHFPRCLRLRDGRTLVNPGKRRPASVLVGSAPAAPHGTRLAERQLCHRRARGRRMFRAAGISSL